MKAAIPWVKAAGVLWTGGVVVFGLATYCPAALIAFPVLGLVAILLTIIRFTLFDNE